MKRFIIPAVIAIFATACTTPGLVQQKYSSSTYQGNQMQRSASVTPATIVAIRQITIQENKNITGATVGAGMGALAVLGLAGTGGNPYGLAAGAIAAGVMGGMATDYAMDQLGKAPGYEFTVRLQNNQIMTIAQSDIGMMAIGDKVYVARSGDGVLRVYK